jgi:hypothetical protein
VVVVVVTATPQLIREFTRRGVTQLQPQRSNLTDKLLSAGKVSVKLGEDAIESRGKLLKLGTKR